MHTENRTPSSTTLLSDEAEQKKTFLLFMKILFKSIEDSEVRDTAKTIVSDCTRRNRQGDPHYTPLIKAIDSRLRHHVGEAQWRRAHMYTQRFVNRETRWQMVFQRVTAV